MRCFNMLLEDSGFGVLYEIKPNVEYLPPSHRLT